MKILINTEGYHEYINYPKIGNTKILFKSQNKKFLVITKLIFRFIMLQKSFQTKPKIKMS